MARTLIHLGYKWHTYYGFSGTAQRDYFEDIRNRIRTGLDPGETHTDVLVTDIVRWNSTGNYVGYFFLVKAMSGGVPTGPVWAINACTGENGQADGDWRNVYWWYGDNGIQNYYESYWDNYLYEAGNSVFSMFYHPTAGKGLVSFTGTSTGSPLIGSVCVDNLVIPTKQGIIEDVQDGGTTWIVRMTYGETFYDTDILYANGQSLASLTANYSHCFNFGFTDHDNGLLGGTISSPTQQDYVDSPFNPRPAAYGGSEADFKKFFIWPYNSMIRGNIYPYPADPNIPLQHVLLYDSDKPFMAHYFTNQQNPSIFSVAISGEIITPYATEDTSRHGALWVRLDPTDSPNPGDVLGWRMWGANPIGGRTTYNFPDAIDPADEASGVAYAYFSAGNCPRYEDWTFDWYPVPVYNGSYLKGELDSDVIRVVGKKNEDINRIFAGPDGPFIKYSAYMAFPWVTGEPTFPPVQWAKAYPWKD